MAAPDCPQNCPFASEMGAHKEAIGNLKKQQDDVAKTLHDIARSVSCIERTLAEQRGGRKALWMLLTASGAAGGLLTAIMGKVGHLLRLP